MRICYLMLVSSASSVLVVRVRTKAFYALNDALGILMTHQTRNVSSCVNNGVRSVNSGAQLFRTVLLRAQLLLVLLYYILIV